MKRALLGYIAPALLVPALLVPGPARAASSGAPEGRASGVLGSALVLPVGRATGAKGDGVRELLGNSWLLAAGARVRLGRGVRLAPEVGFALGQAGPAQRRVCAVVDATCLLLGGTLSLDVELALLTRPRWALWAREGVGVEAVTVGAVFGPPEVFLFGLEILRPGLGLDLRVRERQWLGVFTQAAVGTYTLVRTSSDLDDGFRGVGDHALHARLVLGLRWVFE